MSMPAPAIPSPIKDETHLQEHLDALDGSCDEGRRDSGEESGSGQFAVRKNRGRPVRRDRVNDLLAHRVALEGCEVA